MTAQWWERPGLPEHVEYVIYMITYPNGMIYIGQDVTGNLLYLGSGNEVLIMADLRRCLTADKLDDMIISKKILWKSKTATKTDARYFETEFILKYDSWNPEKGYNKVLPVTPTQEQRERHDYWGGCRRPTTIPTMG